MKPTNFFNIYKSTLVVLQLIKLSIQIKHFDQGKGTLSPINIEYPITYTDRMITGFDLKKVESPTIFRYNNNIYLMQKSDANNNPINGAFGQISHMGTSYNLWQIVFMAKSGHKVGGRTMAMEMHVRGTPEGYDIGKNDTLNAPNDFIFVIQFEKANPDVPFTELYNANIGSGQLKYLTSFNEDMQLSFMKLNTTFNLNNVWSGYDKFQSYEGTDFLHFDSPGRDDKHPPRPATYLIMFQTLWISSIQLEEFNRPGIEYKVARRRKNMPVLSNFEVYKQFDIEQLKEDAKQVAAKIEEVRKKKLKTAEIKHNAAIKATNSMATLETATKNA